MNLPERIQSFVGWLQSHALEGFRDYTEDTYSDDYNTLENVLISIAEDMKTATKNNHAERYLISEDLYKDYFITINEEIAGMHYADLLDDLLDSGLDNLDAEVMAVSQLWKNPLYRKYLDLTVHVPHPKTGEILHLISCHEYARGKHPYVTAEEIEMLKQDFKDPWEYVRNRESKNATTKTRTIS